MPLPNYGPCHYFRDSHVEVWIETKVLKADEISRFLKIDPTLIEYYGTDLGDGENDSLRWIYSTSSLVSTTSTQSHGELILEKLEPVRPQLQQLCENRDVRLTLVFSTEIYDGPGSINLSSELIQALGSMFDYFKFTFRNLDQIEDDEEVGNEVR